MLHSGSNSSAKLRQQRISVQTTSPDNARLCSIWLIRDKKLSVSGLEGHPAKKQPIILSKLTFDRGHTEFDLDAFASGKRIRYSNLTMKNAFRIVYLRFAYGYTIDSNREMPWSAFQLLFWTNPVEDEFIP